MPNAPCPEVSRLRVSRLPCGLVLGYPCDAASAAAYGRLPEWPKGAVCKTVGSAYVGSNPTPATTPLGLGFRGLQRFRRDVFPPLARSRMPPNAADFRKSRDMRGIDLDAWNYVRSDHVAARRWL